MNKRKVAVGPGASSLILIAVVLALSVLTVLTMISARSDEALAIRSVETRQEVYGLFAEAERSWAKLDEVLVSCLAENPEDPDAYLAAVKVSLPDGMKMKGDTVSWTEQSDSRTLECAVRVQTPGEDERAVWTLHTLTAGDIWEDDFDDFDDWDDWDDEDEDLDGEDESEDLEEEEESEDLEDEDTDTGSVTEDQEEDEDSSGNNEEKNDGEEEFD